MYKLELVVDALDDAQELVSLAENNEEIDIITQKNFNGDLTTIELYISLAVNVLAVVVPIVKTMITQKRVSSLKIDGKKIELENVSQELIEQLLKEHFAKESNSKKKS